MTKTKLKTKSGKTLSDLQMDAVILHGLAQAADELDMLAASEMRRNGGVACPAGNALTAVNHVMEQMSSRLADELDELDG